MARKHLKSQLPTSLELLLDTMCNTFGGIVFIAIALVIITQVSTRAVRASARHQASEEELQALQEEIDEALETLKDLKARRLAEELARRSLSPEAAELIAKSRVLRDENAARAEKRQAEEQRLDEAEEKAADAQNALSDAQAAFTEVQASEREAMERLEDLRTEEEALAKRCTRLEGEIAALKSRLDSVKPAQTIALALEEESGGDEVTVYLMKGRLYQDVESEIENIYLDSSTVRVRPRPGHGHGCAESELGMVFRNVSPSRQYVYAWVDEESFDAFCALRSYLRPRGIRLGWKCVDDFVFTLVSNVHHSSSN